MKKDKIKDEKDLHNQKLYKTFDSTIKVADDTKRTLVVTISTPNADRSNDTMSMKGMDYGNFMKNPVVLFAHKYDSKPIAKCLSMQISNKAVIATVEFPPEGLYEEADIIYQMYKADPPFLNAWSIGFIPTNFEMNEKGGHDYLGWEILEFSSVPVPDNPEALTIMRSKGINVDLVIEKKEEIKEDKKDEVIETKEVKEKDGMQAEVEIKILDMEEAKQAWKEANEQIKALKEENEKLKKINEYKHNEKIRVKDIQELVALTYTISDLDWLIYVFGENEVSQDSIDKMTQALALLMEVAQAQAVLGKKSFIVQKAGRTLSGKHEDMLKSSVDHMTKATQRVQDVLASVMAQDDDMSDDLNGDTLNTDNTDADKSAKHSYLKRLASHMKQTEPQLKELDKNIGLTLRLYKQIKSEKGSEKK